MSRPAFQANALEPVHADREPGTRGGGDIFGIAKAITDLDALVIALMRAIPASKRWQRNLLDQLADADREIQVLRMTIALDRIDRELCVATTRLHETLALASAQTAMSRANSTMKAAVRLAAGIAKQISDACHADQMRGEG